MKINKLIYTAVLGALLASCESVETPMFSDKDAFVAFNAKTMSIDENAGKEIQIPVSLVSVNGLNASVDYVIDASAYGDQAAVEGVHYTVKSTSKTISFTEGGESVAYIVVEPIDNDSYDGDVYFDIKLSTPNGCAKGANYTIAVTIADDDHPLAAAGILGTYTASGPSPFEDEVGVVYTWTCEVLKDADDVNKVWFSQIAPTVGGASYKAVMGTVSEDKRSIIIQGGQDLGTYGSSYTLKLDFYSSSAVTAQVTPGVRIDITSLVMVEAYSGSQLAGYLTGVDTLTLTKVQD